MAQAVAIEAERIVPVMHSDASARAVRTLGTTVFTGTLFLLFLAAVPYGTTQSWWVAIDVAFVFLLAIAWLVEGGLSQQWFGDTGPLIIPVVALAAFSFFQTVSFGTPPADAINLHGPIWNAISADPYQTRFFILQIGAIALTAVFLSRYIDSQRRLWITINIVIGIAVASAIFGLVRQTMQHGPGFGLPLLLADMGYGQFINKNHFAFLMEMAFGLIIGLFAAGIKRDLGLIYVAALLPLWTGLVLCGSRGGLVAMMAQIVVAALLFGGVVNKTRSGSAEYKILSLTRSVVVRVGLIAILIGGVAVGTLWLGGDQLASRLEESKNEFSVQDVNVARVGVRRSEIWKATWTMFKHHPIAGVGMGGYWAAITAYHNASGVMTPQQAHNDYFELLASGGIVGFAIGIWFVIVVLRKARESMRSPNRFRRAAAFGAVIGLSGVAIHSLFDFGLHTMVNAFVFATLIAIATSKWSWAEQ